MQTSSIDSITQSHIRDFHSQKNSCNIVHKKEFYNLLNSLIKDNPNFYHCHNCNNYASYLIATAKYFKKNDKPLSKNLSKAEKDFINNIPSNTTLPSTTLNDYTKNSLHVHVLRLNELLTEYGEFNGYINLENLCENCYSTHNKEATRLGQDSINQHTRRSDLLALADEVAVLADAVLADAVLADALPKVN